MTDTVSKTRFVITIFLSAFLLFQVQLMLSKYFLPWFGGSSAVWTTCMLAFQMLLLCGYAYAHGLTQWSPPRTQRRIHLSLISISIALLASLVFLWGSPILPSADWRPTAVDEPISYLLLLLLMSIGLPFFVLSTTNPLIQSWQNQTTTIRSPYRLYAYSNLGSLLGLATYPFLVQVFVPLYYQAYGWAAGYLAFAIGLAWCARLDVTTRSTRSYEPKASQQIPTRSERLLWFGLSACASLLLLALTNQITQEVASVPFLWMLPLMIYLLSFILCFDSDRWYARAPYTVVLIATLALASAVVQHGYKASIVAQIAIYSVTLFVTCMVCHGELARLKPQPRYLTNYFLIIAAGGAAGGILIGIVAPNLFRGFWELPLSLLLCASIFAGALFHDRHSILHRGDSAPVLGVLASALLLGAFSLSKWLTQVDLEAKIVKTFDHWLYLLLIATVIVVLLPLGSAFARSVGQMLWPRLRSRASSPTSNAPYAKKRIMVLSTLLVFGLVQIKAIVEPLANVVTVSRNFYGVLSVLQEHIDEPEQATLTLRHGQITHGMQYQSAARRNQPTSYYGPHSGIALALRSHPRRQAGSLRVGIVGLGVGTLASFGKTGDDWTFYEINPDVIALSSGAKRVFTYLEDSPARTTIVPGDARLVLERELNKSGSRNYDILVIDAFSSDAIPVHLLTREALALYLQHLNPRDGLLVLHISNRFVNLKPAVTALARHFGLETAIVDSYGKLDPGEWPSNWVLLSHPNGISRMPALAASIESPPAHPSRLWTDDFSNLLGSLRLVAEHESLASSHGVDGEQLDILDRPETAH